MIESVLGYGIVAWFGNISVKLKSQINRLVHTAMKGGEGVSLPPNSF